jgi:hypothetical protein
MKVLIGIGDSWTQGVGGVPEKFFNEWGGRVDRADNDGGDDLYPYELENSWVNVLSKKYLPDHKPFNLGMRGYGNRGAVKNLNYYDLPLEYITGGYLIFLLSGRERFDYLGPSHSGRRRFITLYPHANNRAYKWYAENLYSDFSANQEIMLSIIEAQTFAKAYNLKFYFGYAFDNCSDVTNDDVYNLSKNINWGNNITPSTTYFDILAELEGIEKDYGYLMNQPKPLKYLTNCVHPTILGYEIIAEHMYNVINEKRTKLI